MTIREDMIKTGEECLREAKRTARYTNPKRIVYTADWPDGSTTQMETDRTTVGLLLGWAVAVRRGSLLKHLGQYDNFAHAETRLRHCSLTGEKMICALRVMNVIPKEGEE